MQSIFDCRICYKCASIRPRSLLSQDRCGRKCLSPFQPGFRSPKMRSCRKTVLLVTQGHSGRNDLIWKQKESKFARVPSLRRDLSSNCGLEEAAARSLFVYHYGAGPYSTYYQYEIHQLLHSVPRRYNWLCTDLVKCYVTNRKRHFFRCAAMCASYLERQIAEYAPKVIVLFGEATLEAFVRYIRGLSVLPNYRKQYKVSLNSKFKHGDVIGNLNEGKIVFSQFPSQSTANLWTELEKNGGTLLRFIDQAARKT